eukprot:gene20375-28843_t
MAADDGAGPRGKLEAQLFDILFDRFWVPPSTRTEQPPTDAVKRILTTGNYSRGMSEATACRVEQRSGWSVTVERLGIFRFLENFRATHRGKTIAEMRTTTPRRYQMDGWGFLCIVHTPDGGLCGVLNHLTHQAVLAPRLPPVPRGAAEGVDASRAALRAAVLSFLKREGGRRGFREGAQGLRVLGHRSPWADREDVRQRGLPTRESQYGVTRDPDMNIDPSSAPRVAPGLHLFSGGGRLMRPVRFAGEREGRGTVLIGTLEQLFLD